jgi:hypothetical protein
VGRIYSEEILRSEFVEILGMQGVHGQIKILKGIKLIRDSEDKSSKGAKL